MSHNEDPFDESRADVKALLEQARGALRRLRGYAGDDLAVSGQRALRAAQEAESCLDAAAEEVGLLDSVVEALKSRRSGAARRSGGMSADVIAEREDFVEASTAEVASLRAQLREVKKSPGLEALFTAKQAKTRGHTVVHAAAAGGADDGDDDDLEAHNEPMSLQDQVEAQARVRDQQDEALDRVAFGLKQAGEKASLVNMELEAQDRDLDALQDDVTHVEGKLRKQMRKVDDLLDKMSSKRRCGLLACLVLTAAILLLLLFT
eukprot:CAMPEP_0174829402 /NCGR_PEP_ID=MMETSP1114-20130205/1910_1 /TAXON_ID=312471 /ORGANISM="Neobodo designis, Strain CCAP 1951/1" /LENGTH=262 /DNA_ID=CAMNT_0016063147 /DNA_START=41 /DNA_END=825 /DNA_ORIENTATION=+